MMNNIACRVFKEQIKLINQLPENERPIVLYLAVNYCFNQFDFQIENQNENQNENVYVSVSVSESKYLNQLSEISKCVLELLKKNIVCKEFSTNYGGRRDGSGRKKKMVGEHKLSKSNTKVKHEDNLRRYGELKNVLLEEEQYNSLKEKFNNLDDAIEILDTWLGKPTKAAKEARGKNHYAYFKSNSWVWEMAQKKQVVKESVFEHNMRIMKEMEEENANESLF